MTTRLSLPVLVFLSFPLLCACSNGSGNDDTSGDSISDSADSADSADTDDSGDYVPEPGCILVDGNGGYALLQDAIHLAANGSVITVCEGNFEEAVDIDKPVTIEGAGEGLTLWGAPADTNGFTISDVTGVSISGIRFVAVSASRSAISASDATRLDLADLEFMGLEGMGVNASNVANLQLSRCSFDSDAGGGLLLQGGALSASSSTFTSNGGFGVKLTRDAQGSFTDNTFVATQVATKGKDGATDGFGIWGVGAGDLALTDNTFVGNAFGAVFSNSPGALVTFRGDVVEGIDKATKTQSLVGIYQVDGSLDLDGVTVTDPYSFGIFYSSSDLGSFRMRNVNVVGHPDLVEDLSWADIISTGTIDPGQIGSMGALAIGLDITVENSTIEGYNDWGMYVAPPDTAPGTAVFSNVSFIDNGRNGLFAATMDVTATDFVATGLRQVEKPASDSIYVDVNGALVIESGTLDLDGGTIQDNEGWGVSNTVSDVTIRNVNFSGQTYASFIDFTGTSVLEGNTFSTPAEFTFATVFGYKSESLSLQGNAFVDNLADVLVDYGSTDYLYHDQGIDIILELCTTADIAGNTFEGGQYGILDYTSPAQISDNTFSGYLAAPIWYRPEVGFETLIVPVEITNTTVEDSAGPAIQCANGFLTIDGLVATGGIEMPSNIDVYFDDVFSYTMSNNTVTDALSFMTCEVEASDIFVDGATGGGIYMTDSSLALSDTSLLNTANDSAGSHWAIEASWSSVAPSLVATNLELDTNSTGGGVYMSNSSADSPTISFENLSVSNAKGDGFFASGLSSIEITDSELSSNSSNGVNLSSSAITMDTVQVSSNGSSGVTLSSSTASLNGCTLESNGTNGFDLSGTSADLEGNTIQSNGTVGINATSGTLSATDNVVTGNGTYGMSCGSSLSVTECSNTVTGNTSGDNNGCPASCIIP
jgi:hypothetical protein